MALTPKGRYTTNLSEAVGDDSVDMADTSLAVTMAAVPTGGSTAALQTTGNTSLASLVTNTTGVATAALQTSGNAVRGAAADAAWSGTGDATVISLLKAIHAELVAIKNNTLPL
jgi:hypothetical protein